MQLCQRRFIVKRIEVTNGSGTIDHQYLFRWNIKVRLPGRIRFVGINARPNRRFAADGMYLVRKQPIGAQHARQSQPGC